jgi:Fe(3+) dicitrate transport protein
MKQWIAVVATGVLASRIVMATETNKVAEERTRMPSVTVYGEAEGQEMSSPFLPETEDAKIYSGKKTAVIDLQAPPQIQNSNYRQALAKTPGLLLAEESTPLVSIGYRGLDPHRTQYTQVLKDGIPIQADLFGYPEAYYTPPLEQIHHINFLHGGAALLYGPQPGGSINYITYMPHEDREFEFRTFQVGGSDGYYSTYNAVDGTVDRVGYYAYYQHRQGDGFRTANSDFQVDSGSIKLVLDAQSDSRWILNFDAYSEAHGEPGGLTKRSYYGTNTPPANAVFYEDNRDAITRQYDEFALERYFASLGWEKEFSANTLLTVSSWGGYYSRWSKRQRGGGFGTTPTGPAANSNTIELQEFYTAGIESRISHAWEGWGSVHTLAGGVMYYHTDSPRTDSRGTTPNANTGDVRNRSDRQVNYAPVFVENRFVFGKLSLTPGVRLENIWQSVKETVNVDKTNASVPLGDESVYDFVPLFGLGAAYQLPAKSEVYANISQGYRPIIFTQAVPTGGNTIVPQNLDPSRSWQADIGVRGQPAQFFWWDTSVFVMKIDDQIGSVVVTNNISTVKNIGAALHYGYEVATELDLIGWYDHCRKTDFGNTLGSFSLYANAMLLHAEFTSGPYEGNTPQYAPDFIVRTGVNYRWRDRVKLSLLGTISDDYYAADNNPADRYVPHYQVWDLIAEVRLYKDVVSIVGGINNLFNADYYARIRNDGIDPAYGRNFYGGVKILLP